ncbi:MAG: hypothetical protein Fur0021_24010 [Candidatus Promineifilaceae bacterium]
MRWGNHPGLAYDVYLATVQIGSFQIHGVRVLADQHSDVENYIRSRDYRGAFRGDLNVD